MSLTLLLKILGGIAAVALGIYLGLGENRQTVEEMEQSLGKGHRRKAKRHFMWLNWLKADKPASHRRAKRSYFRTATAKGPDDKSDG